jgi:hypothetical protein
MYEPKDFDSGTQVWDSQAKQWLWEEREGIYKQSHLQNGVM